MTNIIKNEPQSLGIVIRQARLVKNHTVLQDSTSTNTEDDKTTTCQYNHHEQQQITGRSMLTTIIETPLDQVEKPTIQTLQFQISNASCHKRKRGKIRK